MELIWILHDSTVYQDKSNHFDGIIYISWLPFGCLPFFWSNDALMLSVLFLCFAWILEAGSKITENLAGQIKTCSSNALASSWAHENPKHQLVRHGHPIEIHHGEYPDRCIFERVWHRLFMGSPGSLTHWSRVRQGGRLPTPNWLSWYLLMPASKYVIFCPVHRVTIRYYEYPWIKFLLQAKIPLQPLYGQAFLIGFVSSMIMSFR